MVIKRSRRGAVSRFLRAKSDKEAITTWKEVLNRTLHTFNVCSAIFLWLLLTVRLQTELAVNTHVIASDVQTMVSDIRRNMLECQEVADDQRRSVSDTVFSVSCYCMIKRLPFRRLEPGQ